jgi:hypothetical protein
MPVPPLAGDMACWGGIKKAVGITQLPPAIKIFDLAAV